MGTIKPASTGTAITPASTGDELSPAARELIQQSVPPNTQRAYERQWRAFLAWCADVDVQAFPASRETMANYVAHLVERGLAPATIGQAIATVRTIHRLRGMAGRPGTDLALQVLRAYRRQRAAAGIGKRQAPPITIDRLRAMVDATDAESTAGRRDRALLVLGFALMARRSELAGLRIDDIEVCDDGLRVRIRESKTDRDSEGVVVRVPHGVHSLTDPVRVVRAWIGHLAEHGVTEGPLLRAVSRGGRVGDGMSPRAVNERVRVLARRAGLPDAERVTSHGLRAGGPTEAARAGVPVAQIARHGRWGERSMQVHTYIRDVDAWRDNPMRGIGL